MPKTSSSSLLAAVSSDRLSAWEDRPAPTTPAETNSTDAPAPAARPRVAVEESVASMSRTPATLNQAEMLAQQGANLWLLFGVTMGSSGVLFVAMRSILGSGQA
jgi:hypothetical protein